MASCDVMMRLFAPLCATATKRSFQYVTLTHWLSEALFCNYQLKPSGDVVTRCPVTDLVKDTATKKPFPNTTSHH